MKYHSAISVLLLSLSCWFLPITVEASWTFLSNSWTSKVMASLTRLKVNTTPDATLRGGLTGYWSFNGPDMIGGTVYDRSGIGNNLFMIDMPTTTALVPGRIGQGLNFEDGAIDYLEGENVSSYDFGTGPFSVSVWFKTTFAGGGVRLVSVRDVCLNDSFWEVDIAAGTFSACIDDALGNLTCVASNAVVNDGEWHHGVAVRDGVTLSAYVDGVFDNSASGVDILDLVNAAPLRIGDSVCNNDYLGEIDEVRIYNRTLSSAEVKRLYTMGK